MIHLVTYGDRQGGIRVLRFTDPAKAYVALKFQCERDELTQIEALWAMRQLAEVCRELYATRERALGVTDPPPDRNTTARDSQRPCLTYTGAGDAVGFRTSPAAESQDTPPPSLLSWFLWLIGVA